MRTPGSFRQRTFAYGMLLAAVLAIPVSGKEIVCPGTYKGHLQGIASDGKGALYWCFTVTLVKTDMTGKLLAEIPVKSHHGDLTCHNGKVYVAVNLGSFNKEPGRADSWVYVYDAEALAFLSKHPVPELVHGAGGMAFHDGRFVVIGGLPDTHTVNYLYEYSEELAFIRRHVLPSGYTKLGIQTACYGDGHWWFGCYGKKLLKASPEFKLVGSYDIDCGIGITELSEGVFLVGRGKSPKNGGRACPAKITQEGKLSYIKAE